VDRLLDPSPGSAMLRLCSLCIGRLLLAVREGSQSEHLFDPGSIRRSSSAPESKLRILSQGEVARPHERFPAQAKDSVAT
jgi:hypothetical protein